MTKTKFKPGQNVPYSREKRNWSTRMIVNTNLSNEVYLSGR